MCNTELTFSDFTQICRKTCIWGRGLPKYADPPCPRRQTDLRCATTPLEYAESPANQKA